MDFPHLQGDTPFPGSDTYGDDQVRLHVQRYGLKKCDVITVTGTATYVNPNGDDQVRLHVQRYGLKKCDVITVTGTATYINPNGDDHEAYGGMHVHRQVAA